MKTILIITSMFFLFVNMSYTQDFGEFRLDEESVSVPIPEKATVDKNISLPELKPLPMKEWTVLVFINGKNNLEGEAINDLNEMERVGSNSQINIVVEMGRMNGQRGDDNSNDNWTGAKVFYVTKDYIGFLWGKRTVRAREIAHFPKINMGDYREVTNFVLWGKKYFPARKYMVVIWDHGSGWEKGNPVIAKGISDDEETGNNISTPQLGEIVSKIGDVEVLSFDACLMQMAEVLYEMKDGKVKYVTASEEIEPGSGYPYDKILAKLAAKPAMGGAELSKIIVDEYIASVSDPKATHSAIDMSKVSTLAEKLNIFAKTAIASKNKKDINEARETAKKYGPYDTGKYGKLLHRDLKDFLLRIKADKDVETAATDLINFIKPGQLLVHNKAKHSGSYGVAVNIDILSKDYDELKIAKDTQFDEFIKWLLK